MDTSKYKLIIFDADGTLRRCTVEGQVCPNRPCEWELMPGVKEKLQPYIAAGGIIGIASNQGGISLGYLTERTAYAMLSDLYIEITGVEASRGLIQLCPHMTKDKCRCRKPYPLMLWLVGTASGITKGSEILYVGDMESDKEAAERASVEFAWAKDFFGWSELSAGGEANGTN